MKIEVTHKGKALRFKTGDIVRNRKSGLLFVLLHMTHPATFNVAFVDVTSRKLTPMASQHITEGEFELFEGTITLTNEG